MRCFVNSRFFVNSYYYENLTKRFEQARLSGVKIIIYSFHNKSFKSADQILIEYKSINVRSENRQFS